MTVLINNVQTKEERRLKYTFLRYMGLDVKTSAKLMDWTPSHVAQYLNNQREALTVARMQTPYKSWRKKAFGERREWRLNERNEEHT